MYDLSLVTDTLRDILIAALAKSPLFNNVPPPFSVGVSGQHPEQPPENEDCDLNLFLFHVVEDKFQRNSFWTQQAQGGPAQPVAFEPMCLELHFLLSVRSATSHVHEQQIMSIALRAFHENAIVRLATPVPLPGGAGTSEITLTIEPTNLDELSRLWQAIAAPLRMSVQYRASVVLLSPQALPAPQRNPTTWTLLAAPAEDVTGAAGPVSLWGTSRRVSYIAPSSVAPSGKTVVYDQTPATIAPAPASAPGQFALLRGSGLADTDPIYLVEPHPDGSQTETDITAWRPPASNMPCQLRAPAAPAFCPPAGRYLVRAGSAGTPGWRSAGVPLSIAPWLDPAGGPQLTADATSHLHTCTAVHVPGDGAELRLGTVALTRRASGTPGPGEWQLVGTTLTFAAPAALAAGIYPVRLRAADVEADPALWAVVP